MQNSNIKRRMSPPVDPNGRSGRAEHGRLIMWRAVGPNLFSPHNPALSF